MKNYSNLIIGTLIAIIILGLFTITISNFLAKEPVKTITLSTTTSTDNSGLLDYLHPEMISDTGVTVDIVAVGTGAAIEQAKNGLSDVVIVHAREIENEFVSDGFGFHRVDLMYNDFVLVGPSEDPANITTMVNQNDSVNVLQQLYDHQNEIKFVSRGDNSGTHLKELSLWGLADITIDSDSQEWSQNNPWYLESGSGMGATLTIASESQAYTITDRGTWLFLKDGLTDIQIVAQGDPLMFNPYGAILVNPDRFDSSEIKVSEAKEYVKWLISPKGQSLINNYTINGEQAFFADFANHIHEMSSQEMEFWDINTSEYCSHNFGHISLSNNDNHLLESKQNNLPNCQFQTLVMSSDHSNMKKIYNIL